MENNAKKLNYRVGRLLVVDDEAELMTALCERLAEHGYETAGFTAGREALESLKEHDYGLLLTDLMMPGMDGIELLKAGLKIDPNLVGIIMTGQGTVETAMEAMKTGAFDYILKPFKLSAVLPLLSRALEVRNLRLENMQLRETVAMHELGKAIAFSTDLNLILNKAADAALQQCEADEASIMLPTQDGKRLIVAVARGGHTDHVGKYMPIDQGIAGWVAQNCEAVSLQREVNDPRFAPFFPRTDIHNSVSLPLLAGGNFVGVLNVNVTHSRRPFTLGQLKALSMLISIVSPILENTRLYLQIRQAEEKYRSIFENASEGIFQETREGRFIIANPAMAAMLGYDSPDELIAAVDDIPSQLYVHAGDRARIGEVLKNSDSVKGFEARFYRKDGSVIRVVTAMQVVRDAKGKFLHYQGITKDITAQKQIEEERKASLERTRKALDATILAMAMTLEARDPYTAGHQRRVAELAKAIAGEVGLQDHDIEGIGMAAIIHDIGKIAIPAEILSKPTKLTAIEFNLIKTHPQSAHEILKDIDFPWPVAQIVLEHHERMDGSGYPQGLRGEQILPASRILAVADVFEAIASHRPYRPAFGIDAALEELAEKKGILYDPVIAEACRRLITEKNYSLSG